MRDKIIGYSVGCLFVLGVLYLKNKVFMKKMITEEEPVEEEVVK